MRYRVPAIGGGILVTGIALLFLCYKGQMARQGLDNTKELDGARMSIPEANAIPRNADGTQDNLGDPNDMTKEVRRMVAEALDEENYKTVMRNPAIYAAKGRGHRLDYAEARSAFGPDDIPRMRAYLSDGRHKMEWRFIAQLIGFVSERGSEESIDALCEYMRRADVWSDVKENRVASFDVGMGKILCLEWIGMIGGEKAEGILLKAITAEGAEELAKEWLPFVDVSYPGGRESALASIRGRAAMGLVSCQSVKGIPLVERMYADEKARCVATGVKSTRLFDELVSAMAYKAFIGDHGLKKRYDLYGKDNAIMEIAEYIRRYWLRGED